LIAYENDNINDNDNKGR